MRGVVDEESIVKLIATTEGEIIDSEEVDSVRRGREVEQRVPAEGVAVAEEFPARCVMDCEGGVHAGVDPLGPALD